MKELLQRARVVVTTSNMKISRRCLADYVKTLHQKACCTYQHDYRSSFNQSNHWFVTLTLPSSNLRFPNDALTNRAMKKSVSPEFFRLYAIAKRAFIALRIIASLDFIPAVQYVIHFIYRFVQWFIHDHGSIWTHRWRASTICGFIAQLFRASQLDPLKSRIFRGTLCNC